jgi:hypothetical protein
MAVSMGGGEGGGGVANVNDGKKWVFSLIFLWFLFYKW